MILEPERLGQYFDQLFRAAWALCGSRTTPRTSFRRPS